MVYRAFDTARGQDVALKTLPDLDPNQVYWLKNEFRALADVRHRNLVELHELQVTDTACFFTMELIDGIDFVTFVRTAMGALPGAGERDADIDRLDDLLLQLVQGIEALHQAGKLHRDIKPSNVLVTPDGRAIVLDFGLALPVERALDPAQRGILAGTPAYMPPEQAVGHGVSPKSDWYALGVMLFEALAGGLPFTGRFTDLLHAKRTGAPDVRTRNPNVPARLAELVSSLLDPDPARRPDGQEIHAALNRSARDGFAGTRDPFVGRAAELASLRDAFHEARTGTVVVHVQGESGIGKSALVQQFVQRLQREEGALVLRGRCHPRESVPYKALDAVVDDLSEVVRRGGRYADILEHARLPALARLFPVLGRIRRTAIEDDESTPMDPVEARRAGAESLARVLSAIAETGPLVIWIDDLQWGDADSAAVLRSILATPAPPRMLVVLSYRSHDAARSPLLAEIAKVPLEGRHARQRSLSVTALPPEHAVELARVLLADSDAISVARDAGGSPFFIRQLVQHRRRSDVPEAGGPHLESIVSDRLVDLPVVARRVLELVSVAGTTLTTRAAVAASRAGGDAYSFLRLLQSEGFVRFTPLGSEEGVEPYHDRIRESVVAHIEGTMLVERHRALADVLEQIAASEHEALLTHHLGAGNVDAALRHARTAAERAATALAFDRAASLYTTALGLVPESDERLPLLVKLAESLDNAGRTGDAADRFIEATRIAETAHADGTSLRKLRRRASECLLRSGRSSEGRELLWSILRSVDAPLPRSERDALVRATLARLPLLVGPLPKPPARPKVLTEAERERLDLLWSAAISLSWEPVTSSFFRARYIREALPTNEPLLVAAALGAEAASQGALRWRYLRRRGDRLVEKMEEIARTLDDPYTTAHAASVRAHNAYFSGRWREALENADREIDLLKRHCFGVSWELAVAHIFSLLALSFLGDMKTLRTRLDAALLDARERGDAFAVKNLHLGQHNFCRLAADEVDEVLEQAASAERSMPADRFEVQHYHHIVLVTQSHLYRGDATSAWRAIDGVWARLKAAQFLELEFTRIELLHLRARAAVALAADRPARAPSAPDLLRIAEQASRAIRKSDSPPALPFAAALDAAVATQRGNAHADAARRSLDAAIAGFERAEMPLHAAAARVCAGEVQRGGAGTDVRRRGVEALSAETIRPEAIVSALMPGIVPSH